MRRFSSFTVSCVLFAVSVLLLVMLLRERSDKASAGGAKVSELKNPDQEKGEAFLAENGKKEGIVTTASGLQYQVIKAGDGPKPKSTDTVTVHYHGTLIDGKVFDSSVERGQPATFALNQVISGWTEGVALMPKGAKYRFFIPHDLAYGSRGAGGKIKPYSALIFEVELLEIK